jgi:hypothetical protein
MASGSFNINAFSRYGELPVRIDTIPYSTLTMFAVGSNSFVTPYSFYDYTNACGFKDTSTITTQILSTTTNMIHNANQTFISTIPLTKWVSTDVTGTINVLTRTSPFYYASTFQKTVSTIPVAVTNTYTSTLISTIYAPPIQLYPNSTPIYPNAFQSTCFFEFQSTIPYFVSTSTSFGPYTSTGVLAASYPFDFVSSYSGLVESYPMNIYTDSVWLGESMSQMINSKQYNVFINYQYSLWLSSSTTSYTWVSTVGYFGSGPGLTGQTSVTRVGDRTYTQITNTCMYVPEPIGQQTQIGANTKSFSLLVSLRKSIFETAISGPSYDLYVPGKNNFTITLVPIK